MNRGKAAAHLAMGMAIVAGAAFLGGRDGYPSLVSTLSVPSILLLWRFALPIWVYLILAALLFALWAYPYPREAQKSRRSLYLGAVLGLLSLIYFIHGYRYAIEYQGAVYFVGMAIFGSTLFIAAIGTSVLAIGKGARTMQIVSDILLFSWFAWLAFPYMGELP